MKALLVAAFVLSAAAGCDPVTFEPQSHVASVRILAVAADQPYAAPGASVTLDLLAFDGRAAQPSPMQSYFLPAPCVNPPGDAFYACFPAFAQQFEAGVDLAPQLSAGSTFSFTMPEDVLVSRPTSSEPYGLVVVFSVACAGRVQYLPPPRAGSPDAVPFTCVDEQGRRLGPDEFVFAYSLVYSFAERTNQNPVIEQVTFGGAPLDFTAGLSVEHCTHSKLDDCPPTSLDVVVPAVSWEPDPSDLDAEGRVLGEQLHVNYYLTAGKVKDDALILFDPREGRLERTATEFRAPLTAGEHHLWVVVRDNRGGVTWRDLGLHVN